MATLPSSLALGNIADGALAVAADHRNNFAAIQTEANALLTILAAGTAGDVFGGVGTTVQYAKPPGYEYANVTFTAAVTVSGTEGAPNDVVSAGAVTFDGATLVKVEFYAPAAITGGTTGSSVFINIWDGTDLGRIAAVQTPAAAALVAPVGGVMFVTPSAGSHTFKARAWQQVANGSVQAGAGGVGVYRPGFIRITKV